MKTCCLVGGGGFLGTHLARLLPVAGWLAVVFDRRLPSPDERVPGVDYHQGDYRDRARLEQVIADADAVVDLAYATVPKSSYDDPIQDIMDNLAPSVGLLQSAARLGVPRVVVVSSGGTVYGRAFQLPIPEEHQTNPLSPYGITKLAVEKYSLLFHDLEGLPVVIARPGNAYGEGQQPFTGQGFVATAIGSILLGKEVTLFGEQGTVRDYVHAEDLARGIMAILGQGIAGSVYNIGSGAGRSNREVLQDIEVLARADGLRLKLAVAPPRSFDVPANILDASRLRGLTGWSPRIGWEEGLQRTWAWLRSEMRKNQTA